MPSIYHERVATSNSSKKTVEFFGVISPERTFPVESKVQGTIKRLFSVYNSRAIRTPEENRPYS